MPESTTAAVDLDVSRLIPEGATESERNRQSAVLDELDERCIEGRAELVDLAISAQAEMKKRDPTSEVSAERLLFELLAAEPKATECPLTMVLVMSHED